MAIASTQSLPAFGVPPPGLVNGQYEQWETHDYYPGWRESTIVARGAAVDRVIHEIRQRLDEPLSLCDMASIAYLSPFHFNRVFRQMTGVSPCRFLPALRLDAAKRLLSDSEMRIIDICFAVGYNSLGSFTTQFTQLVGLSPGRYRRLHQIDELVEPGELFGTMNFLAADQPEGEIDGWISAADSSSYWIFVGAFPTPVP